MIVSPLDQCPLMYNAQRRPPGHGSPYYRSMTPSLATHRYPNASRERYFSTDSQGTLSSSTTPSGMYSSANPYYPSGFSSNSDSRSQFIPTPSEMANTYSTYASTIPRSPTVPPSERYGSGSAAYPAQLLHTTHGGPLRPRISTSRPRSGTLGSSPATSPSGERFPCEKCGKTFSRSHDRKRHHETQHLATPIIHRCRWCEKEFSRSIIAHRHVGSLAETFFAELIPLKDMLTMDVTKHPGLDICTVSSVSSSIILMVEVRFLSPSLAPVQYPHVSKSNGC